MKNIAIIGGGLGGLALAQGLIRQKHRVTVYERDQNVNSRRQGYRISLNQMGLSALRALLPEDRFERILSLEATNVGHSFTFASAKMQPLLHLNKEEAWTMCRPLVRRLLAEDIPIVWNKRFESLEERDRVHVRFSDGTRIEADLVVACDGAGSDVRRFVPSAPRVEETGIYITGGQVPRSRLWDALLPLNQAGAVQYLGKNGQSMFVSFCETEDREPMVLWAMSQQGSYPSQIDRGFHPLLKRLVAQTPSQAVLERISLRISRFGPSAPARARVTVLGDAAHTMPPQRGFGGNSALADAHLLTGLLDDTAEYERQMYARAKALVAESEEAARLVHMRHPVGVALRNTVLWGIGVFKGGALSRA